MEQHDVWKGLQKIEDSVRKHEQVRQDCAIRNAASSYPRRIWDHYAYRDEFSNMDASPDKEWIFSGEMEYQKLILLGYFYRANASSTGIVLLY